MKTFYIFIFCTLFISCRKESDPIKLFFKNIDKALTVEEKSVIDSCNNIDCWISFVLTTNNFEFKNLFDTLPSDVNLLLDSIGVDQNKELCLFLAYCKNRSSIDYNFIEILNDIELYNYNQQIKSKKNADKRRVKQIEFAEKNYNEIQVNDSIILKSATEYLNGMWRSYYWKPYPDDALLEMTSLVLDKWKIDYTNDTSEGPMFNLQIKILDLDKEPCQFQFKKLSIGDTIVVDIYSYEDEIKHVNEVNH